jgi:uncharacterized metal-binding protein
MGDEKTNADVARTLILACSGGSNVGQISNSVMVEMDRKGLGNAFCLSGLGAELPKFVNDSKAARTIVIDGCSVGCAKKIFEKSGLAPSRYFVISDFGIEKRHAFDKLSEETARALESILPSVI